MFVEDPHERIKHDLEEAIMFLASIISREDKAKIHAEIANDPDWEFMHNFSTGMTIRNTLRRGGFFFDPVVNDDAWFKVLREAVCLPEEKIVLTQSIEQRIQKYRITSKE